MIIKQLTRGKIFVMNNWQKVKLKDVISKIVDNRGKTPISSSSGDFKMIEINAIANDQKYPQYQQVRKFVSAEIYNNWFRSGHPQKGDILIPTVGTLNAIAIMNNEQCCIAQNLIALRTDKNICDEEYLYYLLKFREVRTKLLNLDIGGVQPSIKVPHLLNLEINLPSLPTQQKIAAILSAFDDKIELNNKINANLEAQAQALFKRWFEDFEFPDDNDKPYKSNGGKMVQSEMGLIPKGWKISNLTSIATYLNGLAMQKYRPQEDEKGIPVLKIKELGQGKCDHQSDLCSKKIETEYIINDGDVIFSWSGTLMINIWCGGECGLNQHLFKVYSENFLKWFYFYWTKHYLNQFIQIAKDKAVTMGHIKRENLEKSKIFIPDSKMMRTFNNVFSPIFDQIINNKISNRILEKNRDALLPKLINGEIEV